MKSTNKVKFKECDVYCAQSFWHVWHGVKWYGIATSTPIHIQPISTYLWIQFPFEPIFIDCFRFLLFQVFPLTFTDEPVYLLFMQSRRRRQRQHDDCCMPIFPLPLFLPLSFDVNYFETFCLCAYFVVQIKQSLKYETHFQFSECLHV